MASAMSRSVSSSVRSRGCRSPRARIDGVGELGAHLLFAAGVPERFAGLEVRVDVGEPVEDEAFAHRSHDGVMTVDRRGAAGDESDAALPCERLAAVGADVSGPGAVEDLAQRGEDARAGVSVHREDGAEVFADDDPAAPIERSSPPLASASRPSSGCLRAGRLR